MGIVNLTPDSFSDGGRYLSRDAALAHAEQLMAQGADILDLGAESTRPGAQPASIDEELERLLPVIEALRGAPAAVSVDTRKPEVMRQVLAAGADLINDVEGMRSVTADPSGHADLLAQMRQHRTGLCLMHMQGDPLTMQENPTYRDPVEQVRGFLQTQARELVGQGLALDQIILDPGIGFGKTLEHNQALMRRLGRVCDLGMPVLIGISRKSVLGALTGRPVQERLAGSLAAALAAVRSGAQLLRVHDVAATVDALRVWHAFSEPV